MRNDIVLHLNDNFVEQNKTLLEIFIQRSRYISFREYLQYLERYLSVKKCQII
jgi:hypothetical protein